MRADLAARGRVGLDCLFALLRVQRRLELTHVEAEVLGVLLERRAILVRLVGEQLVVHLPELPLLAGGPRRDGRGHGVGVERQRKVPPDHAHLPLVVVHHLGDGRLDARAERALEVRPLDDCHGGILGALHGRALDLGAEARVGVGLTRARGLRRRRGGLVEAVLDERGVDHAARRAGGDLGVRLLHLLVDGALERLERLGAAEVASVDEEVGGAARAEASRRRPCRA